MTKTRRKWDVNEPKCNVLKEIGIEVKNLGGGTLSWKIWETMSRNEGRRCPQKSVTKKCNRKKALKCGCVVSRENVCNEICHENATRCSSAELRCHEIMFETKYVMKICNATRSSKQRRSVPSALPHMINK